MSDWRDVPCRTDRGSPTGDRGYREVTIDGKRMYAHRQAFFETYGHLPPVVGHHCDNPPCSEPRHLFGGTQADNMADCAAKGRARGAVRYGDDHWSHQHPEQTVRHEQHGMAKLTEDDVEAIRGAPSGSLALAAQYGISYTHLKRIRRRVSWQ